MSEKWRESYNSQWEIYDTFSKREDYFDAAWRKLTELVDFHGKTVFEMGCGTGKYTHKLASLVQHLFANDISSVMIERAKNTCSQHTNITYICESAHNSGLPDESVDIIFSAWGYVAKDDTLVTAVEKEFQRILKPGGSVWLLDNYYEGEFTELRGKKLEPNSCKYAEAKFGYQLIDVIPAMFAFKSVDEAADICGFLFGEKVGRFIKDNNITNIKDNIALLYKSYYRKDVEDVLQ